MRFWFLTGWPCTTWFTSGQDWIICSYSSGFIVGSCVRVCQAGGLAKRVCDNGVKLHGRFLGSEPKGSYGGRMSRKPYPSDLTDAQWEELGPLLPPDTRRGHPRTTDLREVVNGILYVLRGGIPWRLMPHDLPPWGTVWWYFRNWRDDGTWERVEEALRARVREAAGREATPSAAIIDSQSVKTTEKGGLGVTTLANG